MNGQIMTGLWRAFQNSPNFLKDSFDTGAVQFVPAISERPQKRPFSGHPIAQQGFVQTDLQGGGRWVSGGENHDRWQRCAVLGKEETTKGQCMELQPGIRMKYYDNYTITYSVGGKP